MLKGLGPARQRRGWTQKELAEESGYSQSYISHLESGKSGATRMKTPYETIVVLSKLLGTTPEYLEGGDKDDKGPGMQD